MPRIILTPGEPAGIGPDIIIKAAQQHWESELIVIADQDLLTVRARHLEIPLELIPFDFDSPAKKNQINQLKIIHLPLKHPVNPGQLNSANAKYVMESLEMAADYCQQNKAQALVTGPVHKGIINEAGIAFTGHTEFLAERAKQQTIMLFVTPQTKVALATTHLALADVSAAITQEKLKTTLRLLALELSKKFGLTKPRILVCGLNPHAGEQGHLGREEIDIITPALEQLRTEQIDVIGPLPADTIFTESQLAKGDAILAMYHDQALPVVKYMSFGQAVNLTLGLPYIRTSVDHGVALDVAGTQQADAKSLIAALQLAIQLVS